MSSKINNTICKLFNIRKSKDVVLIDVILTIMAFLLSLKMVAVYFSSILISLVAIFIGIIKLQIPANAPLADYSLAWIIGLKIIIFFAIGVYILIKIMTVKIATCPLQENEKSEEKKDESV